MTDGPSEIDPLGQLAEGFLGRYRRGERPSLTEYTTRYPQLADQIRDLFPALVMMEELGTVGGPSECIRKEPPRRLGEYRIIREVGRGGMGVVYEAVQESLGRHVALKVFPASGLLSPTHLERFRREAKAAAHLHHTNIVPVFGVGESEGVHYYAMQFIQGQGLDAVLKELARLRSVRSGPLREPGNANADWSIAQGLLSGHWPNANASAVAQAYAPPEATGLPGSSGASTPASGARRDLSLVAASGLERTPQS
ncbi:MAG TPA: protein kinase, partial [Gemmataceae bacterium]|nr:protein kinase [Gemmataceae bacterium]